MSEIEMPADPRLARSASLEFDTRVFRLDAIKKAAYRFGGRCSATIELREDRALVTLEQRTPSEELQLLVADFRNEVLDQDLRELVAKETEAIRNVILAQAFSKTSLLDPVGESADFRGDPLGIQKPDER